jgi:hypothetical protein
MTVKMQTQGLPDRSPTPNHRQVDLTPKLKYLHPLILLQPGGFTQNLIEIGNINLTLSKLIEKKLQQPKNSKLPRSRHIKCQLSNLPAYTSNPKCRQHKERLQNIVSDFIK